MIRAHLKKDIAEAALKKALLEYVEARDDETEDALVFTVNLYSASVIDIDVQVIRNDTAVHGWSL